MPMESLTYAQGNFKIFLLEAGRCTFNQGQEDREHHQVTSAMRSMNHHDSQLLTLSNYAHPANVVFPPAVPLSSCLKSNFQYFWTYYKDPLYS